MKLRISTSLPTYISTGKRELCVLDIATIQILDGIMIWTIDRSLLYGGCLPEEKEPNKIGGTGMRRILARRGREIRLPWMLSDKK